MVHVLATIELQSGVRTRFLGEFQQIVPTVRAEDGCLEYGATVDVFTGLVAQLPLRDDVVVVVEKWRDLPSLEAHLGAPHMTAYRVAGQGSGGRRRRCRCWRRPSRRRLQSHEGSDYDSSICLTYSWHGMPFDIVAIAGVPESPSLSRRAPPGDGRTAWAGSPVAGTVTDETGRALPGVVVELRGCRRRRARGADRRRRPLRV